LSPYPAYKDSGVPWLGRIPAHWEVKRQRNVVDMLVSNIDKHTVEGQVPVRLCNYVDVYKNDRITERLPFMRATASADEIERFRLHVGDVIITKDSEAWNDIGVPALVEYSAPDLVCGYHLAILRPRGGISGGYLLRAIQSQGVAAQYYVSANGVTRYGLSHDAIKSVFLPVPPPPEQHAITRYLDYMDRRIRRTIRAKQKLLALLEEQKQAIIHQAVTRGLDPSVRLKPSGVAWLGDVPEHWEVMPVRRLISFITSGSRGWARFYSDDGDLFVQSGNLGRIMSLDFTRIHRVRVPPGVEGERTRIERDDVLVCITGALTGNVAFVSENLPPAYINQHVALLRPVVEMVLPRFLAYALHSSYGQAQFKVTEYGGTKQGLGLDDVRNVIVALPDPDEQARIVETLDERLSNLIVAMDRVKREIALLREYRTRLLADVVTGQVDVRAAPMGLADEGEAVEELEEIETLEDDEEAMAGQPEEEA
jgi:type I restriction enzyme S subunit